MAESKDTPKTITNNNNPNEPTNLLSLLPKFNLKFPFFNHSQPQPQPQAQSVVKEDQKTGISEREAENKPNFVRLPNANNPKFTAPFGIEVEEGSGRTHKPFVIWQVYALGGFIILKWAWARYKERNERAKKASSDDDQSSDENQSPPDDN